MSATVFNPSRVHTAPPEVLETKAHYERFPFIEGGDRRIAWWSEYLSDYLPAGEVAGKPQLERLERAIRDLRGVASLESLVTIAPKGRRRDADLARHAVRTLRTYFPGNRLRVAAFGGTLVLEGTVDSSATRRSAEVLVARLRGVRRVVNNLRVVEPDGDVTA